MVSSQKIVIVNIYVHKHTKRAVVSQCGEYKSATDHNCAYHISNIRRSLPFFFQRCNFITQITAYSKSEFAYVIKIVGNKDLLYRLS